MRNDCRTKGTTNVYTGTGRAYTDKRLSVLFVHHLSSINQNQIEIFINGNTSEVRKLPISSDKWVLLYTLATLNKTKEYIEKNTKTQKTQKNNIIHT